MDDVGVRTRVQVIADLVALADRELPDPAAPGSTSALAPATQRRLRELTGELIAAYPTAISDYQNYVSVTERALELCGAQSQIARAYAGRRVLVTGGSGCIGTALIAQLLQRGVTDLHSLHLPGSDAHLDPRVQRHLVDIRDQAAVHARISEIAPQVIVHCAAQRSPALAEVEVALTVETNVLGTRNVLAAARDIGVQRFVHASTGKAMRYVAHDVYAATKKFAEWLVWQYAAEGGSASLARFTHVVDNPVLFQKLAEVERDPHGVMRVHGIDTEFYVQSAQEAAQLLLLGGVAGDQQLSGLALRELGEPVPLLGLVVGRLQWLARHHGASDHPALLLAGDEQGYRQDTQPGLFDPLTAGDLSPLINAIEAGSVTQFRGVPAVDVFALQLPARRDVDDLVGRMEAELSTGEVPRIRAELAEASLAQAEASFNECSEPLFARLHRIAAQGGGTLPTSRQPLTTQSPDRTCPDVA